MTSVEEAEATRDAAQAAAAAAIAAWYPEEADHLRKFLRGEATLTAKTQHQVTIALGDRVQEFKKHLDEAADAAASELLAWGASLTVEDLSGEQKLWNLAPDKSLEFAADWIALMRDAGYDPGTREQYNAGRAFRPWGFYNPNTGTQRNNRIPGGKGIKVVDDAVTGYRSAVYGVSSAIVARDKKAAADLWGDE